MPIFHWLTKQNNKLNQLYLARTFPAIFYYGSFCLSLFTSFNKDFHEMWMMKSWGVVGIIRSFQRDSILTKWKTKAKGSITFNHVRMTHKIKGITTSLARRKKTWFWVTPVSWVVIKWPNHRRSNPNAVYS